ncbi:hypothetical protein M5689_001448 [Euphorbia peplus]|nr:hypothetical protein M5689_001448 [Euphorbia peplus]
MDGLEACPMTTAYHGCPVTQAKLDLLMATYGDANIIADTPFVYPPNLGKILDSLTEFVTLQHQHVIERSIRDKCDC